MRCGAGEIVGEEERVFLGRIVQIRVRGDHKVQKTIHVRIEQHGLSLQLAGNRMQSCLFRLILEFSIA